MQTCLPQAPYLFCPAFTLKATRSLRTRNFEVEGRNGGRRPWVGVGARESQARLRVTDMGHGYGYIRKSLPHQPS